MKKGNSIYLSAAELREVYLLVGECCELGADPLLWRTHMLTKLTKLFQAASSVLVDARFDPQMPGIGARANMTLSAEQYSSAERSVLADCIRNMPLEGNPLGPAILMNFTLAGSPVAVARKELISDREWRRSSIVSDYFDPIGWYDMLMAALPKANGFQCINFSKEKGSPNFDRRQSRLLEVFIKEIASISEVRLSSLERDSLFSLPAREHQVLLALAEGDDEKQVGLRLGISRSTVHAYVRRLFQRYCVNSRSELFNSAARQIHAHRVAEVIPSNIWLFRPAS